MRKSLGLIVLLMFLGSVSQDSAPVSATTLTFDGADGTVITNQYAGVVFSGLGVYGDPLIKPDPADVYYGVLSPVLSPNPAYSGAFQWVFSSGAVGVQFDSGYWDNTGTGVIGVYDLTDALLDTLTNLTSGEGQGPPQPGGFHFDLSSYGTIGRVTFDSSGDVLGAAIDNLQFQAVPLPATLPLFASGLVGLGWLSGRRRKAGT